MEESFDFLKIYDGNGAGKRLELVAVIKTALSEDQTSIVNGKKNELSDERFKFCFPAHKRNTTPPIWCRTTKFISLLHI